MSCFLGPPNVGNRELVSYMKYILLCIKVILSWISGPTRGVKWARPPRCSNVRQASQRAAAQPGMLSRPLAQSVTMKGTLAEEEEEEVLVIEKKMDLAFVVCWGPFQMGI